MKLGVSALKIPKALRAVLNTSNEHPEKRTRKIAVMFNVSYFFIGKILVNNENSYHT